VATTPVPRDETEAETTAGGGDGGDADADAMDWIIIVIVAASWRDRTGLGVESLRRLPGFPGAAMEESVDDASKVALIFFLDVVVEAGAAADDAVERGESVKCAAAEGEEGLRIGKFLNTFSGCEEL
jgi:hypothetical protein